MRKIVAVAATMALVGSLIGFGVAAASRAPRGTIPTFSQGFMSGTTRFEASQPGATCIPWKATTVAGNRCWVVMQGKFRAADAPVRGTYSGRMLIEYGQVVDSPTYASWMEGTIRFTVRNSSGVLLGTVPFVVDTGSGGVTGYRFSPNLTYELELRDETTPLGLTLRPYGGGVMQMGDPLHLTDRYLDRMVFGDVVPW